MPGRVSIALTVVSLLLSSRVGAAAPAECVRGVKELYVTQRYVESARAAEACARQSEDPMMLFVAGQGWARAGHAANAVQSLRAYLAQATDDSANRITAQRRLDDMLRRVVAVEVVIPEGRAAVGRLRFVHQGRVDPLVLAVPAAFSDTGTVRVELDAGRWTVWLEEQGVEPRGGTFEATTGVRIELPARPSLVAAPVRVPASVVLKVRVEPSGAVRRGGRLELRPLGGDGRRLPLELPLRAPETAVTVARGQWRVAVRLPGREVAETAVDVQRSMELPMTLRLDRASRARVGLAVGLGVVSLGFAVWGGVWRARGQAELATAFHGYASTPDARSLTALVSGYTRGVNGVSMLSASAGIACVALTDAIGAHRAALATETTVGAGLVIAGAAWLAVRARELGGLSETVAEAMPDQGSYAALVLSRGRQDNFAAGLLGVGAGLAGAGVASLITTAVVGRKRRPGRRAALQPAWLGLAVRGSF